MSTANPSTPPISITDINDREPPSLIEVPPDVLSEIEDVEETITNNKIPNTFKKCWKWMRIYARKFRGLKEKNQNVYHGTNIYGVLLEHYLVLQLLLFFIID